MSHPHCSFVFVFWRFFFSLLTTCHWLHIVLSEGIFDSSSLIGLHKRLNTGMAPTCDWMIKMVKVNNLYLNSLLVSMVNRVSRSGTMKYQCKNTDPTLSYIKQAVNIPYLLLKIWHENVQDGFDYIDFLNATVSRPWFRVSWETGYPIQGRLEREARVVASKYGQTKGRKREQL